MVDAHVGHDRDATVDHIGRVPGSAHADLDHRDVDRSIGEPPQRGRDHDLEVRRIESDLALHERDDAQLLVELGVGDRLAVDRHALVDALEMRARRGADHESDGREELRDHAGRRGLAVRAGEMDRGVLELGRAEVLQQRADALERGCAPLARGRRHADAGLEVHVRVEPRPRLEQASLTRSGGASSTSTRSSAPISVVSDAILPASQRSASARGERGQPFGRVVHDHPVDRRHAANASAPTSPCAPRRAPRRPPRTPADRRRRAAAELRPATRRGAPSPTRTTTTPPRSRTA